MDDARVDVAEWDQSGNRLRLRLLNGDLQTGYGKLELKFDDAYLVAPTPDEAEVILRDPQTEFLVHEVELLSDGTLEVRFLLYPKGELVVRCVDLHTDWQPVADRTRTDYRSEVLGFASARVTLRDAD